MLPQNGSTVSFTIKITTVNTHITFFLTRNRLKVTIYQVNKRRSPLFNAYIYICNMNNRKQGLVNSHATRPGLKISAPLSLSDSDPLRFLRSLNNVNRDHVILDLQ